VTRAEEGILRELAGLRRELLKQCTGLDGRFQELMRRLTEEQDGSVEEEITDLELGFQHVISLLRQELRLARAKGEIA